MQHIRAAQGRLKTPVETISMVSDVDDYQKNIQKGKVSFQEMVLVSKWGGCRTNYTSRNTSVKRAVQQEVAGRPLPNFTVSQSMRTRNA